jgi:hypothetical protein
VTTELWVVPPRYRRIAVSVGVQVRSGYGVDMVRRWVDLVVRQYLAPLPPYGPDGGGWPLGRRVRAAELEAAALQVEGVEYLEGLRLAGSLPGNVWRETDVVLLELDEVPELAEITVVGDAKPIAPGVPLDPSPSPTMPVPVPVLQETC